MAGPARAQTADQADRGADKSADTAPLPAYHHSIFSWEHSLTAQTAAIGDTPQSSNPTYTMGFVARTRYYLLDDTPGGKHFSLRLDGGLYREFTNNDATTKRGEWAFSDTDLATVYARRFYGPADTDGWLFELRPLTLTLPTAKFSYDSGRYFAPGALVGVTQVLPWLRGRSSTEVVSLLRLAAGYKRWFARATVPTNSSLERVRLNPDGRSLPSDALSGSALIRDQLDFSLMFRMQFGEDVLWTTTAAVAPAWKYRLQEHVELCGVVETGCVDVGGSAGDTRYGVRTQFSTEVGVRVWRGVSLELGYGNTESQIGRDGRRRSFFYSPSGSVFYASVSFMPHELVTGSKRLSQNVAAPSSL